MTEEPVYLDHHATTPCHPEVVAAMLPYFSEIFGNPASVSHVQGRRAATALEEARSAIASFLTVRPDEVFFTSGATEANNIILQSAKWGTGDHIISTPIEHKSVLVPLKLLLTRGCSVSFLPVDREGMVRGEDLRSMIRPETRLVSVMAANGEVGTLEPIAELAAICRETGVLFHSDATQAVGKIPLSGLEIPFHLLSLSAHKVYGPKGIGALVMRKGVRLGPLTVGGGQEKGLRSGTVNVAGAVGFARALDLRLSEMTEESFRLTVLRNELWDALYREIPGTTIHGPRESRLPGNLNASFRDIDSEALMLAMRHFSLSSGSACTSADREPSHVLEALGASAEQSASSIRFGLGRSTTAEQVGRLVADLRSNIERLREITPRT